MVIGDPISHSVSPTIHTLFAEQFNNDIFYTRLAVPVNNFNDCVNEFFAAGGRGLNVTSPLKELACRYVDLLTDRARNANAVNTITFLEKDLVVGDSTDGVGLVRALQNLLGLSLNDKRILLLGAGGAIRGCMDELIKAQPQTIAVFNRTKSRAEELVRQHDRHIDINTLPASYDKSLAFDLVINGTSASIAGNRPAIDHRYLKGAVCYDMMYGAKAQAFLKWALAQGATAAHDGLSMLVEQAAESFYLWHELRPATEPVYALLKANGARMR